MCPTLRYLGDSEKMVREYFAKAEILAKTNQSVIFIDEIDAICSRRSIQLNIDKCCDR